MVIAASGVMVAAAAALFFTRGSKPRGDAEPPAAAAQPLTPATADPETPARDPGADDARRTAVSAAYDELQASRKALQQSLGDLKSQLWGRELPAEQARSISRDMMTAQHLLKDPPMLGAFFDVGGVRAEKDKVDAALARLRETARANGLGAPAEK
ncbi:MAG: hypothetical protein HYR49_08760 [Gammaproteobacteria bacterium]|nr:hypothetical protein [Gammaproteobacteria bacterium]